MLFSGFDDILRAIRAISLLQLLVLWLAGLTFATEMPETLC